MSFSNDVTVKMPSRTSPLPQAPCNFIGTRCRKKISTVPPVKAVLPHLAKQPKYASRHPLAANVADVDAITLACDLAYKSFERAGIFNTGKIPGNICPSSRSATKSDIGYACQKRAKTRHFLLISSPSRPKVRAERPCWKRSIRLKY